MDRLVLLGTYGGNEGMKKTTCLQVSPHTLIDAGNIIQGLGAKGGDINHIFLTHSHLDHIVDIPFVMDNFFSQRKESLKIYGLPQTLNAIKGSLFNNDIWPDFSKIPLLGTTTPAMEFIPIELEKRYEIDGVVLTPFEVTHTVPCCGYVIEKEGHGIMFSGDTFKTERLWEIVNASASIHSLIIDVSFPDFLAGVGVASCHLTPQFLKEELEKLQRPELKIYVNHVKPSFREIVSKELDALDDKRIVLTDDMMSIDYKTGDSFF